MKFLRNMSLKQMGFLLLALMFLLYMAEFLVVGSKIGSLEETDEKKDFARSTQLASQQLALQVQRYLNGQKNLAADITSRIHHQDYLLEVLRDGGRVEERQVFIKPLSRLPEMTFHNLLEDWTTYKESITILLTESETIETTVPSTPELTDSLTVSTPTVVTTANPKYTKAKITHEGHWLTLSGWFEKLLKDLNDETLEKEQSIKNWFISFATFDILLLLGLLYLFQRQVVRPLQTLHRDAINHVQRSGLPPNEIGQLGKQVNTMLEQLKDATDFITTIGEGKLDIDYLTLDNEFAPGKNKLADSLIAMQIKLKALNEEERRRQWANEGLTKFVDILRSSNDNIQTLSDEIIAALVKYTNSNQGGLYLLNDDDEQHKHLELVSLFAFNNKKFQQQKLKLGEGILGQTFLEKETTLLTELPEDYMRITSGLGDANPKAVLMVPLKVDQEVYGIVELASFKDYQPHEIAFVERLGETIASTLASVKGAQKNRQLIEQFEAQTEEMRAQEEEMRQNMEELTATQEEMSRKEHDYIARIKELEDQVRLSAPALELKKLKETFLHEEGVLKNKIAELQNLLATQPAPSDAWALAEAVEKSLKINLEAIKITQEELDKKGR